MKKNLEYSPHILSQLSEEQIAKLKAGGILRHCENCRKYFVAPSADIATKCDFCLTEQGQKRLIQKL